jgi:hypothetical protein
LVHSTSPVEIVVLYVDKANKCPQVCEALEEDHVRAAITVMADDDVEWPLTLMPWLLAPFEDDRMGGAGTCQLVKRVVCGDAATRIFNWLGDAYIERRNFEISATHNIDGGTSCMSGRTGTYRTEILKSYDFLRGFKNEKWGRCILDADDDNFVTRWYGDESNPIAQALKVLRPIDTESKDQPMPDSKTPAPSTSVSASKQFPNSRKLFNATYDVVCRRFGDHNTLPFLHVTLVFIHHVTFFPEDMAHVASHFPWKA